METQQKQGGIGSFILALVVTFVVTAVVAYLLGMINIFSPWVSFIGIFCGAAIYRGRATVVVKILFALVTTAGYFVGDILDILMEAANEYHMSVGEVFDAFNRQGIWSDLPVMFWVYGAVAAAVALFAAFSTIQDSTQRTHAPAEEDFSVPYHQVDDEEDEEVFEDEEV